MPVNYSFDATQFTPSQSVGGHPPGKFPARVSNTSIQETKNKDGGMFVVEFTTNAGSIVNRYNLWNKEPKAVEIAHKELSALCYATGIFKLDFNNDGAAMRGAQCMIEVGKQDNGEYMEIKKVYDLQGNEPGKAPATGAAQPQGGGWGAPQGQQAAANPPAQQQQPQGQAWQPPGQQQPTQQQPAQQQAPQGWQPAPGAAPSGAPANAGAPPWAR